MPETDSILNSMTGLRAEYLSAGYIPENNTVTIKIAIISKIACPSAFRLIWVSICALNKGSTIFNNMMARLKLMSVDNSVSTRN